MIAQIRDGFVCCDRWTVVRPMTQFLRYASHLAMWGVPLKVIQELMGHVIIEMTERYAHLCPDTGREAVGVLDLPLAPACDIHATRMEEAANHP
jgi:hypothetical protein